MDSSCSTPGSSRSLAVGQPPHSRHSVVGPRMHHKTSLTSSLHLSQPSSSSVVVAPSVHSVRPGQSYITVHTLTKESLTITVNPKIKVRDVFWKCCEYLDINDDRFFGIALRAPSEGLGGDQPRHEYFFLDPADKLYKYAPKQPRFSGWNTSKTENRPLLVIYFRVRVYIDEVRLITCSRALEHYYIQLRENLLDQWAGKHTVSEERCWEMAALALRADKGDNHAGYFRAEQYFPLWVINERGLDYVRRNMPSASSDLSALSQMEAMTLFCQEASRSPFALNCHLYGLRRHKLDSVDNAVIGITATGIEMCDVTAEGERVPLRALPWGKMCKLSFDKKKLSITGVDGMKISLYAQSESKARYLLDLCRAVHQCLLVVIHTYAGPRHIPYTVNEKSVDIGSDVSNSTSGVVSDKMNSETEKDSESLRHSFSTDPSDGSQRTRSRTASGVRVQTAREKWQMSRETSEEIDWGDVEGDKDATLKADQQPPTTCDEETQTARRRAESMVQAERRKEAEEVEMMANTTTQPTERPVSVDSSCQTVETGSLSSTLEAPFTVTDYRDVTLGGTHSVSSADDRASTPTEHEPSIASMVFSSLPVASMSITDHPYTVPTTTKNVVNDTVRQSTELLNEYYRQQQNYTQFPLSSIENFDPRLSPSVSGLPSSVSMHDLRSSNGSQQGGIRQPPKYVETVPTPSHQLVMRPVVSPKPRWSTVAVSPDFQVQQVTVPHQAHSESRIDNIDMWTQPSVSYNVDPSRQQGRGRYNKGPNRQNGAISRVQSMPAHYHLPQPHMRDIQMEMPPQMTTSLHHSASLNNPSQPRTKARDPPTYERALEIQQRCGVAAEARGHPSFPPATNTPAQFAPSSIDAEALDSQRLRDLPMLRALWAESLQTLSSAGLSGVSSSTSHSTSPVTTVPQQRRPASCLDLASSVEQMPMTPPMMYQAHLPSRAEYILDSAFPQRAFSPYQMSRSQQMGHTNFAWTPSSVQTLPPPPPYPEGSRKAPMVM